MSSSMRFLIGLVLVASGCSSGNPAPDSPKHAAGAACMTGLPTKVRDSCGCGAAQRNIEVALTLTNLNDIVKAEVLMCVNGELSTSVLSKSIVAGKVDGCVRNVQSLEPIVRDQVVAVVADAVAGSSSDRVAEEQKTWLACYAGYVTPPAPRATLAQKHSEDAVDMQASYREIEPTQREQGKKLYDWSIWLTEANRLLPELREVYYSFSHPSFEGAITHSATSDTSFKVQYRGWGCVEKVSATLIFVDESRLTKSFNQCSVMPANTPSKGGGPTASGSTDPGAGAPPPKCPPGTSPPQPMTQGPTCVL